MIEEMIEWTTPNDCVARRFRVAFPQNVESCIFETYEMPILHSAVLCLEERESVPLTIHQCGVGANQYLVIRTSATIGGDLQTCISFERKCLDGWLLNENILHHPLQ